MTIEKLKNYRNLKSELEDVKAEIDSLKVTDNAKGSQKDFPFILCNHKIEGVTDENYSLLEYESDLKAQIKEVERFVNAIPFRNVRKAITIYYIDEIEEGEDKPTWEDVTNELKSGQSSDAIKKMVQRYIKNVPNVPHVPN